MDCIPVNTAEQSSTPRCLAEESTEKVSRLNERLCSGSAATPDFSRVNSFTGRPPADHIALEIFKHLVVHCAGAA